MKFKNQLALLTLVAPMFIAWGVLTQRVFAIDKELDDRRPYVDRFIQSETTVEGLAKDITDIKKTTQETKDDVSKIKGALGID